MMALTDMVMMLGADYQAICDTIRSKTGSTELLKSGDLATLIDNLSDGEEPIQVPTINGRKVASGSFSLAADSTEHHAIAHEDVGEAVAIIVYPTGDMPIRENGEYINYRLGAVWLKTRANINYAQSLMINMLNSAIVGSRAQSNNLDYQVVIKSNTEFVFPGMVGYPLRAGLVYNWIVIGEE